MKRVERLAKIQKSGLFSQKQVEQLSGFTRAQLLKWEEAGIVKPDRESAILYNWNQLIFLRILYHLRQSWTFKQIEAGVKNCQYSVEEIIQDIPKHIFIALGIKNNAITLVAPVELTTSMALKLNDDFLMQKMKNFFSAESLKEYFLNVDNKSLLMTSFEVHKFNWIAIPHIIDELKILGEQLEIENLNLKVG